MITKERLEELIKEEKGCYIIKNDIDDIGYIHLKNKYYPKIYTQSKGYTLSVFIENNQEILLPDNKLFETKEEAEWQLEFSNITRTETLKLPNYENVFKQDRCLNCYTKEFAITKTDIVIGICLFGVDFTNKVVEVSIGADKMFIDELTKENYIEACRICKKLFLGEDYGN